jgi:hypothetical protein
MRHRLANDNRRFVLTAFAAGVHQPSITASRFVQPMSPLEKQLRSIESDCNGKNLKRISTPNHLGTRHSRIDFSRQ